MKKSELRKVIREAIKELYQQNELFKKDGRCIPLPSYYNAHNGAVINEACTRPTCGGVYGCGPNCKCRKKAPNKVAMGDPINPPEKTSTNVATTIGEERLGRGAHSNVRTGGSKDGQCIKNLGRPGGITVYGGACETQADCEAGYTCWI